MLFYDFENYEGFKELFGMRETSNGKDRKNKILLSYVKQRELVHRAVYGDEGARHRMNISSMNVLYLTVMRDLYDASNGSYYWHLMNGGSAIAFYTNLFKQDEYEGLCEDGDARAIRYLNVENGRVFKMKSGKFLRKVMEDCGLLKRFPEQVYTWVCEEFAARWQSYATGRLPQLTLVVDDDFKSIYDGRKCGEGFHSCMANKGYHTFYNYSVKAKAASLRDNDGMIVARCVIFTEVHDDDTGEILRLAERQYSTDCNDMLKRCLVDKLIEAGEIDGYKTVGAGCGDADAFVSNTGEDWSGRKFSIECDLDYCDELSYQDSFKWYDMDERVAYNYSESGADIELDTTEGSIEGGNYDDWHERYTNNDLVTVYYHGRSYECDEDDLDDFYYIDHGSGQWEYHHQDDCVYCDDIEEYVLECDAHHSDVTGSTYYDEDEMARDEEEYKEENWYWSEYDQDWYENEDDVVKFHRAEGDTMTISMESLNADFCFEECEGEYYELVDAEVEAD